jgi:type III pantothenate kinase
MRALLIDAGNTALKFATADELGPGAPMSLAYGGDAADAPAYDHQAFRARLERVLREQVVARGAAAAGCIVASNTAQRAIESAVHAVAGTGITWLQSQAVFDRGGVRLTSAYRDPAQLGADRWHAMLGARGQHDGAFVLVQAGTATTIDGVTDDGRFVGGDILPGWDMMLASLARGTARLPHAAGTPVEFADNTDDAIASGTRDAQVGAVERFWRRFCARHAPSRPARLLLTGGGAQRLAAALEKTGDLVDVTPSIQDNLVLRGLWLRSRFPTSA